MELADAEWEQNEKKQRAKPFRKLKNKLGRIESNTGSTIREQTPISRRKLNSEVLGELWGVEHLSSKEHAALPGRLSDP